MGFRAAEFFAGIGLVRAALERHGIDVVWANDVEPVKAKLYAANFPADHYVLGDIRDVRGRSLPPVDLATASFPCTDLSLAGRRRGLAGAQSGLFWEFARVLEEMAQRPTAVLLENVPALATSHNGRDLDDVLKRLHQLGYTTSTVLLDARSFVPQSRPRLFVIGALGALGALGQAPPPPPPPPPPTPPHRLADIVEREPEDGWWDERRTQRFLAELSPRHQARLAALEPSAYRAAYRRTRSGRATWEIRDDEIAGCLRTARGGSSKQAIVHGGRVRWMTAREYARLQGVDDGFDFAGLSRNKVMFGFGDAVCVPAVAWIAEHCLLPILEARPATRQADAPEMVSHTELPENAQPASSLAD